MRRLIATSALVAPFVCKFPLSTTSATRLNPISNTISVSKASYFTRSIIKQAPYSPLAAEAERELTEELARSGKVEQPKPPNGWTVNHTKGETAFTVTKKCNDSSDPSLNEDITLYFIPPQESTSANTHEVEALIINGSKALVVGLIIEEGEFVLERVQCFDDLKSAKQIVVANRNANRGREYYVGPKMTELDDRLSDSILKYLEKIGINDELSEFIGIYAYWAEQQDYENWLSLLHKFAS